PRPEAGERGIAVGEAEAPLGGHDPFRRYPCSLPRVAEQLQEGFRVLCREGGALERLADHLYQRATGAPDLDAVIRVHGREERAVGRDVPHGLRLEHADPHRAALHPDRPAGTEDGERFAGPARAASDDRRQRRELALGLAREGEAQELMHYAPVRRHPPSRRDAYGTGEREAAALLPAGREPVHALEEEVRDEHGVPPAGLAGTRTGAADRSQERALCVEDADLLRL